MPNSFWPSGVELPILSPRQILEEARLQWEERSGGLLSLEFREDDNDASILDVLVVSHDRSREVEIFWIQSFGDPYPCEISCECEDKMDCYTQGQFRVALEAAMNWRHVRSAASNIAVWINEEVEQRAKSAIVLAKSMSAISERDYCAGWISGLEDILWQDIADHPELKSLSDLCHGWITWIDKDSPAPVGVEVVFLDFGKTEGPALIGLEDWIKWRGSR